MINNGDTQYVIKNIPFDFVTRNMLKMTFKIKIASGVHPHSLYNHIRDLSRVGAYYYLSMPYNYAYYIIY